MGILTVIGICSLLIFCVKKLAFSPLLRLHYGVISGYFMPACHSNSTVVSYSECHWNAGSCVSVTDGI